MTVAMFDYPKQAELNRILPKSKLYEYAKPSRAVRARFITQVNGIVWKYKLAAETVNLPARDGIQEIQVFAVSLKTSDLSGAALRLLLHTIDKAIPSPIFYQLTFEDRVKFAAVWKRPNEANGPKLVADQYFETAWQLAGAPLPPLPVALDMAGLYEQMLRRHIGVPARSGETLREQVERVDKIRAKERECRRLGTQIRKELQFNRKVESNAALRLRKDELAKLQQD